MQMQALWRLELTWDQDLPAPEKADWLAFYEALPALADVEIPRWTGQGPDIIRCELHGFADASMKAYAAAIYVRTVSCSGETGTMLLMSKTKVAPIPPHTLTVPRLGNFAPRFCWLVYSPLWPNSLSTVISHESPGQIRPSSWRGSIALPRIGRFLSRTVFPKLRRLSRTCSGSTYLVKTIPRISPLAGFRRRLSAIRPCGGTVRRGFALRREAWPSFTPALPIDAPLEMKSTALIASTTDADRDFTVHIGSWPRILRAVLRVLSWTPRYRARSEMERAETLLVACLQSRQFPEVQTLRAGESIPKQSQLASLNPTLDAQGLLRVNGRISRADLPENARHPLILKPDRITRLIVAHAHQRCLHGGISLTLSTLRDQFWVLQARKLVRSTIFNCIPCAKIKAILGKQIMGVLPAPRILRPDRPFSHCGVDYAGPLQIRLARGRGHKAHSAYLALFICFATKAVHIEVVSDYSSPTFLAAFARFCARRGLPQQMYSDHGTTFHGADRELQHAYRRVISDENLRARLAEDRIRWNFIPRSAPHFGGLWEVGVKSVKAHLKRGFLGKTPTFEELCTLTSQIEACLNSRPLAPLNDDLESLDALTPAHFLIGAPITALPQQSLLDRSVTYLSRWQEYRVIMERFWRMWSDDSVKSLQARTKWKIESDSITVGQMALLKCENLPPTKWKLARVTRVHPGDDDLVRAVTLRTATSELVRPITKLVLLPGCLAES